jgi:hypothetical protein
MVPLILNENFSSIHVFSLFKSSNKKFPFEKRGPTQFLIPGTA